MDHQGAFDFGADAAFAYLRDGKPGPIRGILADAHGKDAQRKAAASLARNVTTAPTSSGNPQRPAGMRAR